MIEAMIFSVVAAVAACSAIVFSDMRRVILSAWVAGMSVGAVFLSYGAEYLAIVQWIIGTLVAISFFIFATMFGEHGNVDTRTNKERVFDAIPAVLVGAVFFAMLALAIHGIGLAESTGAGPQPTTDLSGVGQALGERHIISLELLAVLLLAVLIGAGVISRADGPESEERP